MNCGESVHQAWRGCTAYSKYIADKKKLINEEREKNLVDTTNVSRAMFKIVEHVIKDEQVYF